MRYFALIALTALGFAGCASGPSIPPDITPAELIQRGQEASDRGRYNRALLYYQAILERFPTYIDMICAAEYEIAHVHYKQKKYAEAKSELHNLLGRYDSPNKELLPPQFERLANIVLEQIAKKELIRPLRKDS
jgi:outer membrane protein assembly factor BamD (BamD/ComL family)